MDYELDHESINYVLNDEDESRDNRDYLWIDKYLVSQVGPLKELVSELTDLVDMIMRVCVPRQRNRKPGDQWSLEVCVDVLVSNLAHVVIQSLNDIPLIVSRKKSNDGQCPNPALPIRTFINCMDAMEASGLLIQEVGRFRGNATTLTPTPYLRDLILSHGIDFGCFRECPSRPLVVLKRTIKGGKGAKPKKEFVSYTRCTLTDAMVSQVERLNAFLSQADIIFIDWPAP